MTAPETPWLSPRAVDEAERAYRSKRFESYMCLVDTGELTRELAILAFKEELEYNINVQTQTQD